jgi:hypothetical protein
VGVVSAAPSVVDWSYVRPSVVHLTNGTTFPALLVLAEPLSRRRPDELIAELMGLYALGVTCSEIAGAVRIDGRRVTESAINRRLHKAGVVMRRGVCRKLSPQLAKQARRRVLAQGRARKAGAA